MSKKINILYWIVTIWLALGMVSTGIVQLIKLPEEANMMSHLGYPLYLLTLLGILKLLGVVVLFVPKWLLLKEWAYAGFFFTMFTALYSHGASGDEAKDFFGPVLLLILILISWYLNRKKYPEPAHN